MDQTHERQHGWPVLITPNTHHAKSIITVNSDIKNVKYTYVFHSLARP